LHAETGRAYLAAGEFEQAEAVFGWAEDYGADVSELIALCERLGELEDDEEGILSGAKRPVNARQQIDFAILCAARGKWERAAANFREGFARDPNLETPSTRYLAATCAARAGGEWLSQAREWLEAGLRDLDLRPPKAVRVELLWWKRDRNLANLRSSDLWRVVDERLKRARE
jgi:tetratricopeptide (TPR) repeat protein